jgi:hypothetical protein
MEKKSNAEKGVDNIFSSPELQAQMSFTGYIVPFPVQLCN